MVERIISSLSVNYHLQLFHLSDDCVIRETYFVQDLSGLFCLMTVQQHLEETVVSIYDRDVMSQASSGLFISRERFQSTSLC